MKKVRLATGVVWLGEAMFAAWVGAGVLSAWLWPGRLPLIALAGLAVAANVIAAAWRRTEGLAIRAAVAWSGLAVFLAAMAQVAAISSPLASGRPAAGHWCYLASLATLAALISVFGARHPGGGAWALLMGLLVLVFLIPWLEGSGLRNARNGLDRLRLDAPWSIFFAVLAIAGVTNYLPTRFGRAAVFVAVSLLVESLALTYSHWPTRWRALAWSLGPMLLSMAVVRAWIDGTRWVERSPGLASLWHWFQDGWGVVWAVRIRERFNRAAESAGWPIRLSWHGVVFEGDAMDIPPVAEATFAGLLRRFASPDRIARAARNPCPPGDRPGE